MANFTRVRSTGMWTVSVLLGSELEKFDANLFKAPNFADGGTYAPTTPITIGGQGIYMTGNFETEGTFATYGDTFIGSDSADTLVISATGTVNAPLTLTDSLTGTSGTFSGTLTANGDVILGNAAGDNITANGAVSCQSTLNVGGDAVFSGNITLGNGGSDTVTANAAVSLGAAVTQAITLGGRLVLGNDIGAITTNISITTASHGNIIVATSLGGAGRTATLMETGTTAGTIKIIKNLNGALTLTVVDNLTSTTIGSLSTADGTCGVFMCLGASVGWISLFQV